MSPDLRDIPEWAYTDWGGVAKVELERALSEARQWWANWYRSWT